MAEMIILLFGLSGLLLLVTIGLYRPGIECKGKQSSCTIDTTKIIYYFHKDVYLENFFFIVYKRPPPPFRKILTKITAKIIMHVNIEKSYRQDDIYKMTVSLCIYEFHVFLVYCISISLFPCIPVSLYSCIPVSVNPCFLVSPSPCFPVSLFPRIPVSL